MNAMWVKEQAEMTDDETYPDWFNGKKIDEVKFCEAFLEEHPMICVSGNFFSLDGRIPDETTVAKLIYNMIRPVWTSGLAKKARNLMETLKIECYSEPLAIKQDRIHFANGTLFLDGRFTTGKNYCINRLPVKYNPEAADPVTWLRFLNEVFRRRCPACGTVFYTTNPSRIYDDYYRCSRYIHRKNARFARLLRRITTCQECGKSFTPARRGAKYCCDACRQKAYRERKRLGKNDHTEQS